MLSSCVRVVGLVRTLGLWLDFGDTADRRRCSLGRRLALSLCGRADQASQSKVIDDILAALQVVFDRIKLATECVVAEVELAQSVSHWTCGGTYNGEAREQVFDEF